MKQRQVYRNVSTDKLYIYHSGTKQITLTSLLDEDVHVFASDSNVLVNNYTFVGLLTAIEIIPVTKIERIEL